MSTQGRHPYILQRDPNGNVRQMSLNVPQPLAREIPETATFAAELVDEGILFRFCGLVPRGQNGAATPKRDVPAWAREDAQP